METARRPTLAQEARRHRIIEAAIDCPAREGWHGTTPATIASEAGISRGSISYHFAYARELTTLFLQGIQA